MGRRDNYKFVNIFLLFKNFLFYIFIPTLLKSYALMSINVEPIHIKGGLHVLHLLSNWEHYKKAEYKNCILMSILTKHS